MQTISYRAFLIIVCGVILTIFETESKNASKFSRIRRQSPTTQTEEREGCKLPPPQQNGKFSPSKRRCPPDTEEGGHPLCQMTPGNTVPHNWPLFHECDPGYALNSTKTVSVCLDGIWRPALPGCVPICPPLKSPDVRLKCLLNSQEKSCDKEMRPGTVASAECSQFYRTNFEMICLDDGNWAKVNRSGQVSIDKPENDTVHCVPECGLSSNIKDNDFKSAPSDSNMITQFPWVAGIYHKRNDRWDLVCAGTLISTHIVITAAHCVVESHNNNSIMQPGDIRVGLGKTYKSFYKGGGSSVVFEVEKVVVHELYGGHDSFYAYDIAMLGLLVDAPVSASIMPVCVDWSHVYTPTTNTTVTLAGWKKEFGAELLELAELKFIKHDDCLKMLSQHYLKLLPLGKFCILLHENQTVFISGAAITYEEEGHHFLIGFASTKFSSTLGATDITFKDHSLWLDKEKSLLEKEHFIS